MKWHSESTVRKARSVSSRIFILCIALFCFSGATSAISTFLEIKWKWLEVIIASLYVISEILLVFSWISPGILVLLGVPWLAHAWLRGINPIGVTSTPWDELSDGKKTSIYLYAIGISAFTLFAVVGFILYSIRR